MKQTLTRYLLAALLAIGAVISGYYLYLFFQNYPLPELGGLFGGGFLVAVIMAVVLQMSAHVIRAYKSRLLLEMIRPTKVRTLFKGLSIGFLFNSLLPLRIGEFIRAHEIGQSMQISRTVVFCTILIERALDGFILGLLGLGLAASLYGQGLPLAAAVTYLSLGLILGASLITCLLVALNRQHSKVLQAVHISSGWLNPKLRDQSRLVIWSAIYGLNIIAAKAKWWRYLGLSVLMWMVYGLSVIWLAIGLLPRLSWLQQMTISLGSYMSVAIPSGPAYLGTFQQSFVDIARSLDGGSSAISLAAVVTWLVMILPISLAGLVLLITRRTKPRQLRTASAEVMKNKLFRDSDITTELSHFLDAYFAGTAINQVLHNYEAGSDFRLVRTFKGGSNAITLLGWSGEVLTVKKITLPQYADKLQAQYDWISERQHLPHMPKLGTREQTGSYYAIDLQYHDDYIPMFDFIHSEPAETSKVILRDLFDFMTARVYRPQPVLDGRTKLESYIATKVIDKVADTATLNQSIASILSYPTITINGRDYANFSQVIARLRKHGRAMDELSQYRETAIHGDLTIDNIIVSPQTRDYILLDPNNENYMSDPVVDIAKTYQSLHSGYEFLRQLPTAVVEGSRISFEESLSSRYSELYASLDEQFQRSLDASAYRSILFHEAVHYCRMLTYRAKINPDSLPAFYAVAVRLFNDFMAQYD